MKNTLMQHGVAAVQAQNFTEAVHWFEQALSHDDKDPQLICCLGQSLCWLGRRQEGLAQLRRAGKLLLKNLRKSKDITQAVLLAEQLQYWNDYDGALDLARQIVQLNSADPSGFQLLAVTYSRLNQNKPALLAARQAVKLASENLTFQILLATLEFNDKQYPVARQRLEKVLTQAPTPEQAFRTHKELAKLLDKIGAYEQVFAHLHTSAKLAGLIPEIQQQDAGLVPGMIDINRAQFDKELLGRWQGTEFSNPKAPIFLIGFLRSGTTLTQEVVGAHPEVFVADESDLIVATIKELGRMSGNQGTIPEQLRQLDLAGINRLRDFYWRGAAERYGSAVQEQRFLDKTTMNTIDLGFINVVFPDAKIVFVMRDPRDVCLSCFMQIMTPTASTVPLLSWQGTADFYALLMNWWLHIKPIMSTDFIEFRYEDAVTDFEGTYRQVFNFLGLSWDPAVVNFHQSAAKKFIVSPSFNQVSQPLYSSSVARWQHYTQEFAAITPTLAPLIKAFGYQ